MHLKVGRFYVLKDTWCGWKFSSIVYSRHVLTLHICALFFTVITRGSKNFPEIYKPPPNSGRHMGDIKPVPYWRPTVWSDLWFMLSGSFCSAIGNLIHFFYAKKKNSVILLKPYGVSEQNLVAPMCQLLTFLIGWACLSKGPKFISTNWFPKK